MIITAFVDSEEMQTASVAHEELLGGEVVVEKGGAAVDDVVEDDVSQVHIGQ